MIRPILAFVVAVLWGISPALAADAAAGFRWVDSPAQGKADLFYNGKPVLRYMYAFDRSTPQRAEETSRVFHHVFGPETAELITKGAGGYEPHHRGLFIGWRNTRYPGGEANFWGCSKGAHQRHLRFRSMKGDAWAGSMSADIDWIDGKDKTVLHEIRCVRVKNAGSPDGPPVWEIDWISKLTSSGGEVQLSGDRQHAGFQFRAAQPIAEHKSAGFIRPKGFPQDLKPFEVDDRKTPNAHVNLGWFAMTYELKGTHYTVEYFEDPSLPRPSHFSERPYGRFGAYFPAKVTPDKPLTMRYRLNVSSGPPPDRDAIQARYDLFVAKLRPL